MIEVGRRGDVSIVILQPTDATRDTALGIMRIEGNAYAARFRRLPHQAILNRFTADYLKPDELHIEVTTDHLRSGEEDGWFWSAALLGERAVSFALYQAKKGDAGDVSEIHLAELHTDPEAQRQGFASATALAGLRQVCRRARGVTGITPVTLTVARENIHDPCEHPFAYYQEKLGFVVTGRDRMTNIGGARFPTQTMATTADGLDEALSSRVDIDLQFPEQ